MQNNNNKNFRAIFWVFFFAEKNPSMTEFAYALHFAKNMIQSFAFSSNDIDMFREFELISAVLMF